MKVLVDIGNSCIKWATLDENGLSSSQRFRRGKTGVKTALNKAWKSLKDVESIHVANVAGEKAGEQLIEWAEKQWQLTPVFIDSEANRFGVTNAYEEADKLGIDRWLSLIAARQHARQAQCIIDCGTAITIDIITQNGQHQGGMILPGLGLMQSSLTANTDALTKQPDQTEFKTLATNSYSAIQAGTLYCVTATLERIIADLRESFDNQIRFIITGGDAERILSLLPDDIQHYPDIVLKGLALYVRQPSADSNHKPSIKESSKIEEKTAEQPVSKDKATEPEKAKKPAKPRKPRRTRAKKTNNKQSENQTTLPEEPL